MDNGNIILPEGFYDDLFELIKIQSISSLPEKKAEICRCAEKWKELLLKYGADKAEIIQTEGNPIVYAEKTVNPNAGTVLVYATMM